MASREALPEQQNEAEPISEFVESIETVIPAYLFLEDELQYYHQRSQLPLGWSSPPPPPPRPMIPPPIELVQVTTHARRGVNPPER